MAFAATGSAAVVYQNDFESPTGPERSTADRDTTPLEGRILLGRFSGQSATLNLTGPPPHTDLTLSMELVVILTWDRNGNANPAIGPDIWDLTAGSGPTLRHTTFSNGPPGPDQPPRLLETPSA